MQTASQIIAAKRSAKAKQKIQRKAKDEIGAGYTGNRNNIKLLQASQTAFRIKMRQGNEYNQQADIDDLEIYYWLCLQEMHYQKDRAENCIVFEQLIRAVKIIAKVYDNSELNQAATRAEHSLNYYREHSELSPNQARIALKEVANLIRIHSQIAGDLPVQTVEHIAGYNSAVHVCLYTTTLYQHDNQNLAACLDYIQGNTLKAIQEQTGWKQSETKQRILQTAYDLYNVLSTDKELPVIKELKDLRHKAYQRYNNLDKINAYIKHWVNKWLIPFEDATGIRMIDYKKFRDKISEIQIQHT